MKKALPGRCLLPQSTNAFIALTSLLKHIFAKDSSFMLHLLFFLCITIFVDALVAEQVDAADLKSVGRKAVPVRFRPSAPFIKKHLFELYPKSWTVKKSPEDCDSNFRDNFLY